MKRYCKSVLWLALIVICLQDMTAQVPVSIKKLTNHKAFNNGLLSISAIDAGSGDVIVDYHSDIALIPASSLKVITTFSALHYLGADYKFKTSIYTSGEVDETGMLIGDLTILGSGDPTLGSPDEDVPSMDAILERIFQGLVRRGVTCINGNITVDASIFDKWAIHDTWSWDDLCNYYASGAYGLNIHENYYKLYFQRSTVSNTATYIESIEPDITGLQIINEVHTGPRGSGDNAYLYGDPYSDVKTVRGTIPPGRGSFNIKGAIPRPPVYFGQVLKDYLGSKGIQSQGVVMGHNTTLNTENQLLLRIMSPKLSDIIRRANHESNNLYCESLLRTIGALIHQPAGFVDGLDQVKSYLKILGLSEEELQMKDGSGLSSFNRITPHLMSTFIIKQLKEHGTNVVTDLLPEVGSNGTVKGMLHNLPSKGSIWLKSGSISGVLSYTGVIKTKSGKTLAFCLISNGHSARNAVLRPQIEKILNTIYVEN